MARVTSVCYNCFLRLKGSASFHIAKYCTKLNKNIDSPKESSEFLGGKVFSLSKLYSRKYSSSNQDPPAQLMNIPVYTWPSILKTIRNSIFSKFIINNYIDPEFELDEFLRGSMQAVEIVSSYISNGQLKELSGLVTEEAINEINTNLKQYSLSQRMDLKITKEDIYFKFPYQIGIILPDKDEEKIEVPMHEVEIMMVYHVLKDYKLLARDNSVPLNMMSIPGYEDKLHILNYRFYKAFFQNASGNWIINGLNHFKPLGNQ